MYSLCDVNFVVALLYVAHPQHGTAKRWLQAIEGMGELGLCRLTQLETLRILNNPGVMGEDVCTGRGAWAVLESLMEDSRFELLDEPPGLQSQLKLFTSGIKYSPKDWQDAYLAAFAVASKRRMVTFNRGLQMYAGLDVELLD